MNTLKDFNNSYVRKENFYNRRRKEIVSQVNDLQSRLARMKYPSLEKTLLPIIKIIKQKLKANGHLIYGPFGIGCETTVYWVKDVEKEITTNGNVLGSLTLITDDFGWMIRDESKDSKHSKHFKQGTIGELNGMNHPSIKITEKMDIGWLLKFVKR